MSIRYTFRLKPERDADLIAWLDSLGEGERSCFIRNAIRRSLNQGKGNETINQPRSPPSFLESDYLGEKEISQSTLPEQNIMSKLDRLTDSF